MSRSKKRKKLNGKKFLKFIILILMLAAVIIAVIKFAPALLTKVSNDKKQEQAKEDPSDNKEPLTPIDPQPEKDPYEDWPDTITTADMYPLSSVTSDILVLVNKTHKLTKDYKAADLVTVTHCDENVGNKNTRMMRKIAADAFEELYEGAQAAGFNIIMRTGYRSYAYQESLYSGYVKRDGEEAANKYSAKPGESEHQTGLCCDVGTPGSGNVQNLDGTKEAEWVADNAWKYGFILRFPEDKTDITGYTYESWHIRYVGKEAAKIMYENNLTLEEYLEKLGTIK